jgi:hypothetical protein
MTDERFESLPVLAGSSGTGPNEPEQPRRPAGVQARNDPALVAGSKLDVPGPDQDGVGHVDEAMAQDVLTQEDFAVTALEPPKVDLRLGQGDPLLAQFRDPFHGYEYSTPSDLGDQSSHERIVLSPQADDDVIDLADALIGRREQRSAQQCGKVHNGTVPIGWMFIRVDARRVAVRVAVPTAVSSPNAVSSHPAYSDLAVEPRG